MRQLFASRPSVTPEVVGLARRAWSAFGSPDPRTIERLLGSDTSALPYLAPALRRHLEQFPSVEDGLSRTERVALDALADRPVPRRRLFALVQAREETPFMTDVIFFGYVEGLVRGAVPLVTIEDDEVRLTAVGREVLDGRADAIGLRGIDRSLGGVRLHAPPGPGGGVWRWNRGAGRLAER